MAFSGSGNLTLRSTNRVLFAAFQNFFTMGGFVRSSVAPSTSSLFDAAFGLCGGGFQNPQCYLHWDHTDSGFVRSFSRRLNDGSYRAAQFSSLATDTWLHLLMTYDGSLTRAYLDGTLAATSASGGSGSNQDAYASILGAVDSNGDPDSGGITTFPNGHVAEVGYWDTVLSVAEIQSLAKGFRPSRVRPANLRAYFPMVRERVEQRNGPTTIAGGSVAVSDHPRVFG